MIISQRIEILDNVTNEVKRTDLVMSGNNFYLRLFGKEAIEEFDSLVRKSCETNRDLNDEQGMLEMCKSPLPEYDRVITIKEIENFLLDIVDNGKKETKVFR